MNKRCWILDKSNNILSAFSIQHRASSIRILIMRCGDFKESYIQDDAIFQSWFVKFFLALFFVFLLIFPFVANAYLLYLANMIGFAVIGAVGLNLLTGFTGQISLGHSAFHRGGGLYLGHPDHPLTAFPSGCRCPSPGWSRPWPV